MYTFKMQVVLDHRQFIEDSLQKELADIRQQVNDARAHLKALQEKAMDTAETLKQQQTDGLSSDRVVAYHAYLERLYGDIDRQERLIDEINLQERRKQAELLEAVKKRQILETLKEQEFQRYTQAMLKKDMNFIDEIAVNQFARKAMQTNGEKS
jgi:flagellar protein FliJ